jgi:hypothetical protein
MAVSPETVERLYGLPLDEFTAARDAEARRLRDEGDREAAEALRRLPKPTLAAWTVNQLARREPDAIQGLLEAGEALRAAQAAVMGGGDPSGLREAGRAERDAVDALVDLARSLLSEAGRGEGPLERVRETLQAAAGDEAVRVEVRSGRVVREHRPSGLGAFALGDAPPAPSRGAKERPAPPPPPPRRDPALGRRRREARAALQSAQSEVARREREAGRADERVRAAGAALAEAEAEASRAAEALEAARERLREAEAEAEEA